VKDIEALYAWLWGNLKTKDIAPVPSITAQLSSSTAGPRASAFPGLFRGNSDRKVGSSGSTTPSELRPSMFATSSSSSTTTSSDPTSDRLTRIEGTLSHLTLLMEETQYHFVKRKNDLFGKKQGIFSEHPEQRLNTHHTY